MRKKKRPDVRDIATAIMQRAPQGHVILLSDPPTFEQRLHLTAARIDRRPIVVLAPKRANVERDGSTNEG